jgi:hypothetical protein
MFGSDTGGTTVNIIRRFFAELIRRWKADKKTRKTIAQYDKNKDTLEKGGTI